MAYEIKPPVVLQVGAGAATSLTSTGVAAYTFVAMNNIRVTRLVLKVTTATVSSGSIVVTYRRRPAYGSASGQSSLGTISVPTAIAADKVYYNNITPVVLNAGDQICFDVTTAAAGGSAAGIALFAVEYDLNPEDARNLSSWTLVTA